ncbi:DUF4350 domain-containing protein [Microbacterium xanthum]|uniref:DUF4350 domain-containing protein n=1 Tax=Microbacterium xanthum TaxID=3079794 RepID=UPI002AD58A5E|nr:MULTISPECIES: DUF4350 domain-containing protein [unclassified Microbacterium]MDZ8171087.1 DUF4350 domain-containing protein [Microbacterium sp. KSW-48]MDZ8201604.1 DUF4350 domain-containing protein [Microbacterium sp. SSW1-59]
MSATTVTPRRARAVVSWTAIAAGFLVVGLVGSLLAGIGQRAARGALDPDSAGPDGTRALAEILRANGVDVIVERSWERARETLAEQPATLFLPGTPSLSDDAIGMLADEAATTVFGDPTSRVLREHFAGAAPAGFAVDELAPMCDLPVAVRADRVGVQGLFSAGGAETACYPDADAYGVLVQGRLTAIDADGVFTNDALATAGNAALAVGMLGGHERLVWYVASSGDSDLPVTDPTLGELTPPWVTPAIVLLVLAGVVAGVARGRRFGPLVAERLPVTVRAGETDEGRGRLYAASHDAAHAAAQLRGGAVRRLSALVGLGLHDPPGRVADAVAEVLGADRATIRGLLLDHVPRGDGELVELADRLRGLESAVRARLHTPGERNRT